MKLLVLGGTRFLGRHVVDAALARRHEVTVFTRGQQPSLWKDVTALVGNRDPRIAPGLASLERGRWDAVVDTSGYVPRIVGASAALLAERIARYLFVSSISVYASSVRTGQDETAPLLPPVDPDNEAILENYGALKASCEGVVRDRFGIRATNVRPGLIVGPFDPTDRFSYWVARFVHPRLLGERARQAVVPAPRNRPIQFIDARDLAEWIVELLERDIGGTVRAAGPSQGANCAPWGGSEAAKRRAWGHTFNAVSGPGQWTMGDLIDALIAASPSPPEAFWIDDAILEAHGVAPWTGLPLWIPASDADAAGFLAYDASQAQRAGLRIRPLAQTIGDTAAWLAARDNAGAWKNVLDAATERAILAGAATR